MRLFIGDTIQKLRKIKGLTQEQVANALGITTAAVSKWETNNTYPDISLLSPLARLLGTSVDNILNFKEKLSEEEIDNLLIEANKEFEKSNVIKTYNNIFFLSGQEKRQRRQAYGLPALVVLEKFTSYSDFCSGSADPAGSGCSGSACSRYCFSLRAPPSQNWSMHLL